MEITKFLITEIRLVQSLWEKKSIVYIANVLDRTIAEVKLQISNMDTNGVKLYQAPTFDKVVQNENWAKQIQRPPNLNPPDLSKKIAYKLDSKTTVFANPGSDIEALKKKYLKTNQII